MAKNLLQTKSIQLLLAITLLVLMYVFISLGINDGNLLLYVLALVCLYWSLKYFIRLGGSIFHGNKKR